MPKKEDSKTGEETPVTEEKKEVKEEKEVKPVKEEKKVKDVKEEKKEEQKKEEKEIKKEEKAEEVKEAKEVKKEEKVEEVKEAKKVKKEEKKEAVEEAAEKKVVSPKVSEALVMVKGMSAEDRADFGVSMVKELSVLELSEWVKTLEKEFGVSAQAAVAVAGGMLAGAQGSAAPAEEEKKDSYTVMLTAIGDKKIQVIKEVRTITSLGLREAKALVDEAPKPVKEGVSEQEANEIKSKLEAAGASVELK
jgi:large subunit ribosomal protein L7/L12